MEIYINRVNIWHFEICTLNCSRRTNTETIVFRKVTNCIFRANSKRILEQNTAIYVSPVTLLLILCLSRSMANCIGANENCVILCAGTGIFLRNVTMPCTLLLSFNLTMSSMEVTIPIRDSWISALRSRTSYISIIRDSNTVWLWYWINK